MKKRHQPFRKKPSERKPIPSSQKSWPQLSGYARYFHLIYLMAGSIAVFFGCGYLLDKLLRLSVPVFKVILSFAGVVVALYLVYRELNRKN